MSLKPAKVTKKKEPKEELQKPKGTRDLLGSEVLYLDGFIEKASEIAMYYGFSAIITPTFEKESLFTRSIGDGTDIIDKEMYVLRTKGGDKLALRPEGTAPVMRAYFENGLNSKPQPVMLYYAGSYFRHERPQRGRLRELRQFGIEIIGTSKSIADALTIHLLTIILKEVGIKNYTVSINSIGDKDSQIVYKRELSNYYRKHLKSICADCRVRLKNNPLRVLDCKNEKCDLIKAEAPETLSFLSNDSKRHFKEVLEYLDKLSIPYTINTTLVRGLDYYSHTVFEIIPEAKDGEEALSVAGGGRYDYLGKQLSGKKDVPGMGGAIGIDRLLETPGYNFPCPRIVKKPKIFFIQLSYEAKLISLTVTEILRKAKIPVAQSLSKDSLGAQLGKAERLGVPYVIILGQKEALDETVIIRNMDTRSQDTVKINDLTNFIKKIK